MGAEAAAAGWEAGAVQLVQLATLCAVEAAEELTAVVEPSEEAAPPE